jgi:transglutaminase-like putative cysteine protease
MKNIRILFPALLMLLSSCSAPSDYNQVLEDIQENLDFGNITAVIQITDSLKKVNGEEKVLLHVADSLGQIAERIGLDFSVTEEKVNEQIEKLMGPFTPEEKSEWDQKGWLEWRTIDGEKKYFKRAASNLALLRKFHQKTADAVDDPEKAFRLKHTGEVVKLSEMRSDTVLPVTMKITYTITVHPDAVPEGEKIECWLPWPKVNHLRQKNIILLGSSNPEYIIAPDTAIHSSIYMTGISKKGVSSVFQVSYSYTSYAQYYDLQNIKALPYNKTSDIYQKYTAEQLPHICFTDDIRHLADSITTGETDPASIVRSIYFWFKENIPWTGALEYSIMPNIPEYVLRNMRGDCGMQDFLFISMLRYKGIPARWQSGWMMPPGSENLHDWCEVYYEGAGWIPVDISYDLQKSDNKSVAGFYLSGIDSYRLILNDGVAGPLHPSKKYLRSEPYDFQRGEVEWNGGNLYFDKWNYDMTIEYLK